jgi:hypothetical protein
MDRRRYLVFRSFLTASEERSVVKEALECHRSNASNNSKDEDWERVSSLETSLTLSLGISCGGDLSTSLPIALGVARRAFHKASLDLETIDSLKTMSSNMTPLTGLGLVYGTKSSMSPHYDSPTQPGQREEWLAMMTLGLDVQFRINDSSIVLNSGDVLVMDSMATLHGVEKVIESSMPDIGLPHFPCRLGILFWQGRQSSEQQQVARIDDSAIEGMSELFFEEDSEEDE